MRAEGVRRHRLLLRLPVYGEPAEPYPSTRTSPPAHQPYGARSDRLDDILRRRSAVPTGFARSPCATSTRPAQPPAPGGGPRPRDAPHPPLVLEAAVGMRARPSGVRHGLPDAGRHRGPGLHPRRRTSRTRTWLGLDAVDGGSRIYNLGCAARATPCRAVIDAARAVTGHAIPTRTGPGVRRSRGAGRVLGPHPRDELGWRRAGPSRR